MLKFINTLIFVKSFTSTRVDYVIMFTFYRNYDWVWTQHVEMNPL